MEVDEDGGEVAEASSRPRRRHRLLVGLAIAVAVMAIGYLALLVVAPRIDRLHVARGGWRLYRCQRLGGSIPVDFPGLVDMRRDVAHRSITAVEHGDERYVAEVVTLPDGSTTTAVWVTGYQYGGPFHPARAANEAAVRAGVWLRPFRNLIYTMPPYVTGDDDLGRICSAIAAAAQAG